MRSSRLTSWHVAYVTGAVIVLCAAVAVLRHLPHDPARHVHHAATASSTRRAAWPVVVTTALSMALLACSSQFLFVTYGSWLDEHFGFSAGGIAVVTFGLGILELVAGVVSVGRTDRWGKERSVLIGTSVMAPAAVLVVLGAAHLWLLLPAFGVFLMGFELAIISGMPLGALLTPGRPATGLAILIGSVTCGRALTSIPATAWLESHGLRWPAIGAVLAAVAAAHLAMRLRHVVAQPSVTNRGWPRPSAACDEQTPPLAGPGRPDDSQQRQRPNQTRQPPWRLNGRRRRQLPARVDRGARADGVLDRLGDVEREVVAEPVGVDQHADGQPVHLTGGHAGRRQAEHVGRGDAADHLDGVSTPARSRCRSRARTAAGSTSG